MSTPSPTRLEAELDLLQAMYPTQTTYTHKPREFKYCSTLQHATLLLRLPDSYPGSGLPDIISATAAATTNTPQTNVRNETVRAIKALALHNGEECLDTIVSEFEQVVSSIVREFEDGSNDNDLNNKGKQHQNQNQNQNQSKTVIIWLHHLLNTNKRKLCLNPPASVSGLSKPGYPGVLVFSGPAFLLDQHVATLKAQNWAAFQVRYEEACLWRFGHGKGVKEVQSMSELVSRVDCDGEQQKDVLLKAVGIR